MRGFANGKGQGRGQGQGQGRGQGRCQGQGQGRGQGRGQGQGQGQGQGRMQQGVLVLPQEETVTEPSPAGPASAGLGMQRRRRDGSCLRRMAR